MTFSYETLGRDAEAETWTASIASHSLKAAVAQGEPQSVLLTLLELTGRQDFADRWAMHITGPNPWDHTFSEADLQQLRSELTAVSLDRLSSNQALPPTEAETDVDGLIDSAQGTPLSKTYHRLAKKEMGLEPDTVGWTKKRPDRAEDVRVAIIGAGPSGITAAIRMQHLGLNFTLFDSAEDFGGTWLHNTYPGCGVDIASHYFSFSYDQKSDWSRYYAKQPEILDYLQGVAERAKLHANARFGTEVVAARFDESAHQWELTVHSKGGEVSTERVDILITAVGLLSS